MTVQRPKEPTCPRVDAFRGVLLRVPIPLLAALFALACAPVSEPATGPVAEQVLAAIKEGSRGFDHSPWDSLLAAGTRDGLVDYELMRERRGELDAYLQRVAEADLSSLSGPHLMALLFNAYNAHTVTSILDHPGIASIQEIDGVWDKATHPVGGFDLTLDNIEHNLLRPFFKDPRIHIGVNCASMSCAPLPPWAFDGDRLEEQLDQWTRAFFTNPKYLQFDPATGRLAVSRLLDWYGDDFTSPESAPRADSLSQFIARYSTEEVRDHVEERSGDVKVEFLEYDWSLNQAP